MVASGLGGGNNSGRRTKDVSEKLFKSCYPGEVLIEKRQIANTGKSEMSIARG